MKIAIVHDDLVRRGGAEQVALSFHYTFPDAPIYTLAYNPETTYEEFKECKVITSWFGKLVESEKNMKRFFFPFGMMAMQQLKVYGYDVVLQSTTFCAKYVKVSPGTLVITYCHTPFRLVWRPDSYAQVAKSSLIKKTLYNLVFNYLKKVEIASVKKTDWFLTNATEVVQRIEEAYHPQKPVTVINPPVKCKNFFLSDKSKDYFLVVSRFEAYKKVDLVIDAFNLLKLKLIVVGSGTRSAELKAKAGKNIEFRKGLSAAELADLYANCKAFIFPQHEDYGITPLEANASGRPVIAYAKGGVLETMIPYTNDASKATALFFNNQNVESLGNAIKQFETLEFDPQFIRKHAETFDEKVFVEKLQGFITKKYQQAHQLDL